MINIHYDTKNIKICCMSRILQKKCLNHLNYKQNDIVYIINDDTKTKFRCMFNTVIKSTENRYFSRNL